MSNFNDVPQCKPGCEALPAVGDLCKDYLNGNIKDRIKWFSKNSIQLAYTITPSPYKKYGGVCYKDISHSDQEEVIKLALDMTGCSYSVYFELTQKGSKHAHGDMIFYSDADIERVSRLITELVGYTGKHNKETDFILFKRIRSEIDHKRWRQYCEKDQGKKWSMDEILTYLDKDDTEDGNDGE